MALIDNVIRIKVEDFKPEDQEMAGRIAEIYNFFAENVQNVINGNLSYENFTQKLITLEVTVDTSGKPITETKFVTDVGLIGTSVINHTNLTNSTTYPTGHPYITWTPSGTGTYTINNVTGLPANNKFQLSVELKF